MSVPLGLEDRVIEYLHREQDERPYQGLTLATIQMEVGYPNDVVLLALLRDLRKRGIVYTERNPYDSHSPFWYIFDAD